MINLRRCFVSPANNKNENYNAPASSLPYTSDMPCTKLTRYLVSNPDYLAFIDIPDIDRPLNGLRKLSSL